MGVAVFGQAETDLEIPLVILLIITEKVTNSITNLSRCGLSPPLNSVHST